MELVYNLEYNTEREMLIIPEYGRHFQKMVDHAITIEDREERIKVANAIISVMGNLQPHLRDVPEFNHKLWDQLFIMSDFYIRCAFSFSNHFKRAFTAKARSLRLSSKFSKIPILRQ